jgi:hypothetical protein
MPAPGTQLGVDFGTSNTVAVVRLPDGRSRSLLFDGSPLLPSAVYAEPTGAVVVGRDAIHSARLEPARFEPNPKRRIDDSSVLLGDREIGVQQLVASVLSRVADEFKRTVGDAVPEVTITCPAAWGATRRLVLSDAAVAAGLGQVRLVPEPVAAATYFTQVLGKQVPVGSVVVVHDFGAGTFDASVVARTSTGFEVLAVDGRDDIGGLDVDEALIGHVRAICNERDPAGWARLQSPSTVDERRARRMLWDDVRIAKERLSRQPTADLTVPLLNVDIHITREELEELARPVLEQTVRVTQGVMRWANLPQGQIAGVFLVGGSSRMPLVATMLHRAIGEPPVVIDSPELVVAEGSLQAGSAAVPQSAAPAPGPATGVFPRLSYRPDGTLGPVSPGTPANVPQSGPPVSAPPGAYPYPSSAPPVSGPPPVYPASGPPVSAPPQAYPPQPYPQNYPPAGYPPPGGYPGNQPGPYAQPSSQPYPPVNQPPPGGQSFPGGQQVQQQPQTQQQPVTYPPPGYQPQPTSTSFPPTTQSPPVSAPPSSQRGGAVYTSGRASIPRDEPAPAPPVRRERRHEPEPEYERPAARRPAAAVRRSGGGFFGGLARVLRTVLVTVLLIMVPIVAGYVAYRMASDQPVWPPPW